MNELKNGTLTHITPTHRSLLSYLGLQIAAWSLSQDTRPTRLLVS